MRAAVGFRPHSGWAVALALGLEGGLPVVLDRRRLELAGPDLPGSRQPYHAVEGVSPAEAEAIVAACIDSARELARLAAEHLLAELAAAGYSVVAAGLVGGAAFEAAPVAHILASHTRMHAAEGALFQDVLRQACAALSLALVAVPERQLLARAAAGLGHAAPKLERQLAALGRQLGPPWRQDQKQAALAAWLALAGVSPEL